jgi:hypothetical protein
MQPSPTHIGSDVDPSTFAARQAASNVFSGLPRPTLHLLALTLIADYDNLVRRMQGKNPKAVKKNDVRRVSLVKPTAAY